MKEKVFLFVVASRGRMFTSAKTAAADMGMSRASFYRTRDALIQKGYLRAEPRPHKTTVYELKSTSEWMVVSHAETTPSHTETHPSPDETSGSQADDEKVTSKAPLKKFKKTPKKQLRRPQRKQATKPVARRARVG